MTSFTQLMFNFLCLWLAFHSFLIFQFNSPILAECSNSTNRKFKPIELLTTKFESLSSKDGDLDICKAFKLGNKHF